MDKTADDLARMRWFLAVNPDTQADVLEELATDPSPALLERIAENPNANAQTLAYLAQHEHAAVRAAVAENANTPARALSELVHDESSDVRYSIAENAQMPLIFLHALLDDDNPYVANRAHQTIQRVTRSMPAQPAQFPAVSEQRVEGLG